MSTSKKRHIQESNLIIEKRFLQTEGFFIERKLPEDIVNNALKLASKKEPTKSSVFDSLLSNPNKNKYKNGQIDKPFTTHLKYLTNGVKVEKSYLVWMNQT